MKPKLLRVVITLFLIAMVAEGRCQSDSSLAESTSDAILLNKVREFFDAWSRKDMGHMQQLWSQEAPARIQRQEEMQQEWATHTFTFSNLSVSLDKSGAEWSYLHASAEMAITDIHLQSTVHRPLEWDFTFYRQAGQWKLWTHPSAVEDLARALTMAENPVRQTLLCSHNNLVTSELVRDLLEQAGFNANRGDPRAAEIYQLIVSISESINDQPGLGAAWMGLGNVLRLEKSFSPAIEYFQKALDVFQSLVDASASAEALGGMALCYTAQGELTKARDQLARAVRALQLTDERDQLFPILESLGNVNYDLGNYEGAVDAYRRYLEIRGSGSRRGLEQLLTNIGSAHAALKQYPQAMEAYQEALEGVDILGDRILKAQILSGIGTMEYQQRHYDDAVKRYRQALQEFETLGDKPACARLLESLGNAFLDSGNSADSLEFFEKNLSVQESLNSSAGVAAALNNLGRACMARRLYDRAQESFEKSLARFESLEDKNGILGVLQNLANANYYQVNYAAAMEHYQKALELAQAVGYQPAAANALLGMGIVRTCQGDYPEAMDLYQRSLKIAKELGDQAGMGAMLHNIGVVFASQRNFGVALEYYLKSLEIVESLQDKPSIAKTLGSIGMVHASLGNYPLAIEYHQRALALQETLGDKEGMARSHGNIAGVHYVEGKYDDALTSFQTSLGIWESLNLTPAFAATLSYIGDTYFKKDDLNKALSHYQKSLELQMTLQNQEAMGALLAGIAHVQRLQGNPEAALDSAQKAVKLALEAPNQEVLWYARYQHGEACRLLKRLPEAKQSYSEAVDILETLRKQAAIHDQRMQFHEGKSAPYLAMAGLLIEEGKTEEAFIAVERAKLQGLTDILDPARLRVFKEMTRVEAEQELKLIGNLRSLTTRFQHEKSLNPSDPKRIQELQEKMAEALPAYEAFENKLALAYPELMNYRGRLQALGIDQVRNLLPERQSAILEYAVGAGKTYLFVATPSSAHSERTLRSKSGGVRSAQLEIRSYLINVEAKELAQKVFQFRRQVLEQSDQYATPARDLYDLLLKPAEGQLQGKTRWLVIPDGVLWLLPFQALQPESNRFLIEDVSMAYLPSLSAFHVMSTDPRKNKRTAGSLVPLMAFGAPQPSEEASERIKTQQLNQVSVADSRKEVDLVSRLYGPGRRNVFTGTDAREDRVENKGTRCRILHLAIPAVVDDLNPLFSHLLFSASDQDPKRDGLLETWEVLNADLRANMAVLSASEYPWKRMRAGEGLVAMQWAFFVAGCPKLALSQWIPPAAAVLPVMTEFHRQVGLRAQLSGADGSESNGMRKAILSLMQSTPYRHPFFWSNWVVLGAEIPAR